MASLTYPAEFRAVFRTHRPCLTIRKLCLNYSGSAVHLDFTSLTTRCEVVSYSAGPRHVGNGSICGFAY